MLSSLSILLVDDGPLADISALSGMTSLTNVNFDQVVDLTPLAGLTNLRYLSAALLSTVSSLIYIDFGGAGDLEPIRNLVALEEVWAYGTNVSDISWRVSSSSDC